MKKLIKNTIVFAILPLILFMVLFVVFANVIISRESSKCYSSIDRVPESDVALLLGTAKFYKRGGRNLYYRYRIEAAANLYKAGKVNAIICSGDNATKYYDEPTTMKQDLMALGIPEKDIYLDYAGFRTLDSVVRAKKIFSQSRITIVSQPFHNERALYIAHHNGIDAVGFNAKDVRRSLKNKTQIREPFARVKTILDLYVLKTEPKFYGDKIEIQH